MKKQALDPSTDSIFDESFFRTQIVYQEPDFTYAFLVEYLLF